jgi:hypothetical protein
MGRTHYTACQSGNYDVASTWCADDIPTASAIVDIPAPFTVTIPVDSQPEFFRLDIHGVLEVHIDAKFPPAHPFTISVFDSGILTDVEISNKNNLVEWLFPSNSILFVHIEGQIRTKLPVVICNADSSSCTTSFNRTTGSFTIANTHLGQLMFKKGLYYSALSLFLKFNSLNEMRFYFRHHFYRR